VVVEFSSLAILGQMEVFTFDCPELLNSVRDSNLIKAVGRQGITILEITAFHWLIWEASSYV
jgi:hypothetical protein